MTSGASAVVEILERFAAVGDRRGLKSFEREQLRHHLAQIFVVFHDQDWAVVDESRHRVSSAALLDGILIGRKQPRPIIQSRANYSDGKVFDSGRRRRPAGCGVTCWSFCSGASVSLTFWDPDEAHYAETTPRDARDRRLVGAHSTTRSRSSISPCCSTSCKGWRCGTRRDPEFGARARAGARGARTGCGDRVVRRYADRARRRVARRADARGEPGVCSR